MAIGLWEGLDETYLAYRLGQTAYLAERLRRPVSRSSSRPAGMPFTWMPGACCRTFRMPNFPGQALAAALYLEGAIRGVEIGSVMFAYPDPDTGEMVYPKLELVRLAIPRAGSTPRPTWIM